jgi:hypothetical protein
LLLNGELGGSCGPSGKISAKRIDQKDLVAQ